MAQLGNQPLESRARLLAPLTRCHPPPPLLSTPVLASSAFALRDGSRWGRPVRSDERERSPGASLTAGLWRGMHVACA